MTETKTTEDLKKEEAGKEVTPTETKVEVEKTPIEKLPDDIQKHIKDLRAEAKTNRITAREATEKVDGLQVQLNELSTALEDKGGELKSYKEKEKEAKLAEANAIEKLQIELDEAKQALDTSNQAVTLKDAEVTALKTEQARGTVTGLVDEFINAAGYQFRPYQRAGLLAEIHKAKEDGSYKSSEEVKEMVDEFLEINKETPPIPPGGGGKEKTTEMSMVQELQDLIKLGKRRALTTEEYAKLQDLQAELNKRLGRT